METKVQLQNGIGAFPLGTTAALVLAFGVLCWCAHAFWRDYRSTKAAVEMRRIDRQYDLEIARTLVGYPGDYTFRVERKTSDETRLSLPSPAPMPQLPVSGKSGTTSERALPVTPSRE